MVVPCMTHQLSLRWWKSVLCKFGSWSTGWAQKPAISRVTPRKINMEPENTPLEEENHLPNHHFQVLCKSSRVYNVTYRGSNPVFPIFLLGHVSSRVPTSSTEPIQELKKPRTRERLLGRFLGSELGFRGRVGNGGNRVVPLPRWSMYGIFTYIYHKNHLNVGKYTIHGWYGLGSHNLFLIVVQGVVFFKCVCWVPYLDVLLVLSN